MKKFIIAFCFSVVGIIMFANSAFAYNYPNGVGAMPGDILVTDDTLSKGITGHAAIVINKDEYIETRGEGDVPRVHPLSSWFADRKSTKIIRVDDASKARDAAWNASQFAGSNIPYKITNNLLDNRYTYCSKLVWQAYAFTSDVFSVEAAMEGRHTLWPPYNFLYKRLYIGANPEVVYQKGMALRGDI